MEFRDGINRVRDGFEPVREWCGENGRAAVLIAVAGALLVAYLIFFTGSGGSRRIDILYRPRPDLGTVVFFLGDEHRLRSITVIRLEDDGSDGEVVWGLERDGKSKPLSTFAYGQPLPGMRATGNAPVQPLLGGASYRLTVVTSSGRARVDFQPEGGNRARPGG